MTIEQVKTVTQFALEPAERTFLCRMNYTTPIADEELRAIKRCMTIESLGFTVTHEIIDREVKITRDAERQRQAKEAAEINNWLDSLTPAQTAFVSWVTDSDPRTAEQRNLDQWQDETEATREGDRPL